jgi:mRNA interferase MazF
MSAPARGDIWLVDFGTPVGREQAGARPAVVLSADLLNESRAGVVIIVPCTTTHRGLPSHIELDAAESGLDVTSYAKCEDLKSISEERLVSRLGRAPVEAVFAMSQAVRFLLDL